MSAVSGLDRLLVDGLERRYEFRQPAEVRAFLADYPVLPGVLTEALDEIPRSLPSTQPIALEILRDPDDDASVGTLFAVIRTEADPADVRSRLGELRRRWLIGAARRVGGRFNVDVEYV